MKNYKKCSADYKTSANYKRLIKLLKAGKQVVCFVTYDFCAGTRDKPMLVTDVCIARYDNSSTCEDYHGFKVGCRGTAFFDAVVYQTKFSFSKTKDVDQLFIKMCKKYKLTYVEPTLQ